jgi:hypothetical protein
VVAPLGPSIDTGAGGTVSSVKVTGGLVPVRWATSPCDATAV